MRTNKVYLGDGAYANFDGHAVVLTTENGSGDVADEIVLEPEVLEQFLQYAAFLKQKGIIR